MGEYVLKDEEINKLIRPMLKECREFSANLCKDNSNLHIEKLTGGSQEYVKSSEPKCDKGKFTGDIHTHCDEKGISDVDIFQEVQWNLNKERPTPRLSCVTYPMYNKKDKLFKLGMECDCIKNFGEKEILDIPTPVYVKGKRVKRKEDEIKFFKEGSPKMVGRAGGWAGMLQKDLFVADMHNIRNKLQEKGLIKTEQKEVAKITLKPEDPHNVWVEIEDEIKLKCENAN